MKGCKVCLDSLWKDGKPCPNRFHYYRPKGKTAKPRHDRDCIKDRKSLPGAPNLNKKIERE